ncbi:tRNA pseudouridine(55) synthase TruB [Vulgatibacter incomptus]|uniref:tRNA pseudouridine synthase B n=1 Tax=Vulgatibacter incomptus TaxID=1391653 RepID=A0A0K1P939_9BACT|nr:tRNA pseudouridine(55) synthase TruB [Vulgatibacter incomptus]AKU90022.1 tRNA pseudouridine synthase B [Vulgatibacter incomptus]
MDGILIVDKPEGPTSFDVVKRLRRLGRDRKAGHTGTLDPMATGVLPICLGDATKLVPFVMEGEKDYEGVVALGVETDTYDATGTPVEERDPSGIGRGDVEAAVAAMVGEYWQTPPMYSAVKVGGRRLYELARKGEEVERKPRKVRIDSIELLDWDPSAATARIHVRCGKGTYIRSIAHELGQTLGVGGHLARLRRLRTGSFPIERAVPFQVVLDVMAAGREAELEAHLVGMRDCLPELPEIVVDDARARKVLHGMALGGRDLAECGSRRLEDGAQVRVVAPDGGLLAVGEMERGGLRYARVLVGRG